MMVVGDDGVEGCLGSVGIGWRDMDGVGSPDAEGGALIGGTA